MGECNLIEADVVIIGAGVIGLFTAIELAQRGVEKIVVLERRQLGAGSSGRSGAILRQHYSHEVTIRMARESLHVYRDFEHRTGHTIGFTQCGMLFLAGPDGREALERNVQLQQSLGVDVELLDADDLRTRYPPLRVRDDELAAIEHDAAYVDPIQTLHALAEVARNAGVMVNYESEVMDIRPRKPGEDRRLVLTTGSHHFLARHTVNCAGPWASRIGLKMGIDLPLHAIRSQQSFHRASEASDAHAGPILADLTTGAYRKPEHAGWIRAGWLAYESNAIVRDPNHFDETASLMFVNNVRETLVERLPAFAQSTFWAAGSGLYTMSPDTQAMVGRVPPPGKDDCWMAAGFSGHGFKLAPSIGRGLAAMITGATDTGAFDPDFFSPNRFGDDAPTRDAAYRFGILG